MDILSTIVQLILSLSILVVLHEFGHYIPARLFGTRVEKFFLFFDAGFALVKKKIGDTVWGIGWIPFGGYVKISGMIDESMDKDQMAKPPQPWEFRAKPAWQRLIIMVGGVTVNLLLGMFIYICVLWVWGRDQMPLENVTYGIHPSAVMQESGFEEGDRIVAVQGSDVRTLEAVGKAVLLDEARVFTVERDGERIQVVLPGDVQEEIMDRNEKDLFAIRMPFYIDSLIPGGNASRSTLLKGDRVVAVSGIPTPFFHDFVAAAAERKGQQVLVDVEREGKVSSHLVQVDPDGRIGVASRRPNRIFSFEKRKYSLVEAIPAGIAFGWESLSNYVGGLKLLKSSSGIKQVGGFGTMSSLFGGWGDWQQFWMVTAFFSIALAFMNILPIPALDGGHVVFLLYEMIFRRTPNQKVMEVAQMVGMVLLLSLILFANGNDLLKAITGRL